MTAGHYKRVCVRGVNDRMVEEMNLRLKVTAGIKPATLLLILSVPPDQPDIIL